MEDDHVQWCKSLFGALTEGGVWIAPRSNLTFVKQGDKFVYRGDDDVLDLERLADLHTISLYFEEAGVPVVIDTLMADLTR